MRMPTDFVAEVELELAEARRRLRRESARWSALEELCERATEVAARLRRPVTVVDVLASAEDEHERRRVAELVRELRSRDTAG